MNNLSSLEVIFFAALEKGSPQERAAYLDEACAGNPDCRSHIEKMLAAQAREGSFLETPALAVGATLEQHAITEGPGTIIGRYKLLQQIGEGGMGIVYMAEQTHPVQRKVALKVIKVGMDTRQVIARFEAERQALAMMDHANIARVLDVGATESGRPYFVMELVHGVPITKYCDDHQLAPRQRLELFVSVCQAIQHAHQKGIIHRDIKPSNVMVTLYDGKPVPKVIDFGVAKATEQKLTERTLFTQYGTMVGTLEYMSPEQAEMSALGVDTRSDIYSLGVLLYELLTGSTPLGHKRLKESAYAEILRLIREEETPKPSTRLSDPGEALATISAHRQMEPAQLAKMVRGELDWIVMKTLEKDRSRRYETATDFAMDVQRYLNDETVQACPPSARYRLRKLYRRNRGVVIAGSVILVSLIAGIIGTTWGLIRADTARHEAVQSQRAEAQRAESERLAKLEALEEKSRALAAVASEKKAKTTAEENEAATRAVLDFVENKVFAAARPEGQSGGLGRDVTLRRAVEAALPFVEKSFPEQPLIEAHLRMTLARSFHYLGDANKAAEQYQTARALYTRHRGPEDPWTLRSMMGLAASYNALGRNADALKLNEETLSLRKAQLGPDHPDTFGSMMGLANSYAVLGRLAEAVKLYEETLALQKAKLGPDHPDTLGSMINLAASYDSLGRHTEALKLHEQSLALLKAKLGTDHPDILMGMNNLALSYAALGRYGDALKLSEETLTLMKAKLGPDHPDTLGSMLNLANNYMRLGRYSDAVKLYEETVALTKAKLGPDHPGTLSSMMDLAAGYQSLGRNADALKLQEETLALMKSKLGPDHPATLQSMGELGLSYAAAGRYEDALKLNEGTLALMKAKLGPDHPDTLSSMHNLANSYAAVRRYADALKLNEHTLSLQKAKFGPDHPDTLKSMLSLATSYADLGRHAEALKLREETLALMKAKLGPDHPDTLGSMHNLANSYADLGRNADALKLHEETLKLAPKWARAHSGLAWILANGADVKLRDPRRALQHAREAVELEAESPNSWQVLGWAYYRTGAWKESIGALEKSMELQTDGGDPHQWFFLAMAHWKLDQKDEARRWYDWAVQWMEKHQPNSEESRRFRAEAEELLEVKKK